MKGGHEMVKGGQIFILDNCYFTSLIPSEVTSFIYFSQRLPPMNFKVLYPDIQTEQTGNVINFDRPTQEHAAVLEFPEPVCATVLYIW